MARQIIVQKDEWFNGIQYSKLYCLLIQVFGKVYRSNKETFTYTAHIKGHLFVPHIKDTDTCAVPTEHNNYMRSIQ